MPVFLELLSDFPFTGQIVRVPILQSPNTNIVDTQNINCTVSKCCLQMKRFLHICSTLNPESGGPAHVAIQLSMLHTQMGHQSEILTIDAPATSHFSDETIKVINVGPGRFGWSYSRALIPWLTKNLPYYDGVTVHGLWQYPSWATARTIQRFRRNRVVCPPLFIRPCGMMDPWFQSWERRPFKTFRNSIYWELFERKALQLADRIVYTNQQECDLAQNTFPRYPKEKDLVIPLGVAEPPSFSESMESEFLKHCPSVEGKPFILFLSRLDPKKGLDLLIQAYMQVYSHAVKHNPQKLYPRLVIAGPGKSSAYGMMLQEMAKPMANQITFTGMLTGDAKWGAFYGCDAFILPSHQENFGLVVAEALACGKKVFLSRQVNIWREIVEDGVGVAAPDTLEGAIQLVESAFEYSASPRKDALDARKTFDNRFQIANTARIFVEQFEALSSSSGES